MKTICIDTSIFIEFARTKRGNLLELKELASKKKVSLITSAIVVYEFWSGKSMDQSAKQREAKLIFEQVKVIDVDEKIAQVAGELTRHGQVHHYDALIAATVLSEKAELATLNTKHFSTVKELKLFSIA